MEQIKEKKVLNEKQQAVLRDMQTKFLMNATTLSRTAIAALLERTDRDIDQACNYPLDITAEMYRQMYSRNGIANRAARFLSNESWKMLPDIYEVEDTNIETEFEKDVKELAEKKHLFSYLKRADILSGIGRYGVLLLGIDDGLDLAQPAEGVTEDGEIDSHSSDKRKLLYLKPFQEASVTISQREENVSSPRYGMPKMYQLNVETLVEGGHSSIQVHWTRVVHLADNREESDVLGVPRMKTIWNMLLDIRKLLGGSAEMFWKGAFPGYSFEVNPEYRGSLDDVEIDSDAVKEEFEKWANGLQRWMALTGVSVKSLSPQVSDPSLHLDAEFKAISLSIGVPYRVFIGTEEAKLASSQDVRSWNARIDERRDGYLTDYVIRPVFDRLIQMGVLTAPKKGKYVVEWPDLNTLSDLDQADVALKQTQAMSTYVSSGVDQLVAPKEYMTMFLKKTMGEAEQIEKGVKERFEEGLEEETNFDNKTEQQEGDNQPRQEEFEEEIEDQGEEQ